MIDFKLDVEKRISNHNTHTMLGARLGGIRIGSEVVETPTRAININELNAKSYVPEIPSLFSESPIFIYEKPFNLEEIVSFTSKNQSPRSVFEDAKSKFQLAQNALFKLFVTSVSQSSLADVYKNYDIHNAFLQNIITISSELKLNLISIPILFPHTKQKPNLDYLDNLLKKDTESHQYAMIVDMRIEDSSTFQYVIDKILSYDRSTIPIIMLKHQPETNAINNYRVLSDMADIDRLLFFIDVDRRYYTQMDATSTIHGSEFIWADVVSLRYRQAGGGSMDASGVRFFRSGLDVLRLSEIKGEGDAITPPYNTYYSKEYTAQINSGNYTDIGFQKLNSFARIHEVKFSTDELSKSRRFLKSSEARDYFGTKPILNKHFDRFL